MKAITTLLIIYIALLIINYLIYKNRIGKKLESHKNEIIVAQRLREDNLKKLYFSISKIGRVI